MKKIILILTILFIANPCMANFYLTPTIDSQNADVLIEEIIVYSNDINKKMQMNSDDYVFSWYIILSMSNSNFVSYLKDLNRMAVLADRSKDREAAYRIVKEHIENNNHVLEAQGDLLNTISAANISYDLTVSAEKLKDYSRKIIKLNNELIEAMDNQ